MSFTTSADSPKAFRIERSSASLLDDMVDLSDHTSRNCRVCQPAQEAVGIGEDLWVTTLQKASVLRRLIVALTNLYRLASVGYGRSLGRRPARLKSKNAIGERPLQGAVGELVLGISLLT